MIYLGLAIRSPFKRVTFRNYWNRWWRIPGTDHKNLEIELVRTENLLGISLDIHPWRDHGGATIMFGVLHHEININLYDTRHWDVHKGQWMEWSDDQHDPR